MDTYLHRALNALGDPTRRAIFERLSKGPSAVVDLARELPVSRPAVSQHLQVLRAAGLVVVRADGTRRLYQADSRGIDFVYAVCAYLPALGLLTVFLPKLPEAMARRKA